MCVCDYNSNENCLQQQNSTCGDKSIMLMLFNINDHINDTQTYQKHIQLLLTLYCIACK